MQEQRMQQLSRIQMFGYATDLRSFTQGRGNYTMQFDRYEAAPKSIREEIIKKNG